MSQLSEVRVGGVLRLKQMVCLLREAALCDSNGLYTGRAGVLCSQDKAFSSGPTPRALGPLLSFLAKAAFLSHPAGSISFIHRTLLEAISAVCVFTCSRVCLCPLPAPPSPECESRTSVFLWPHHPPSQCHTWCTVSLGDEGGRKGHHRLARTMATWEAPC